MSKRIKRLSKFLFRVGVSIALFFWLFTRMDSSALFSAFKAISLKAYLIAFLMYLLSQFISSLRWFIISKSLDFPGTFLKYLKYYFVGMYFNLFLPTGVGGDLLKILYLTKEKPQKLKATYTIIMDRTLGLAAMFVLGGISIYFIHQTLPDHIALFLKSSAIIILLTILTLRPLYYLLRTLFSDFVLKNETLFYFLKNTTPTISAFSLSLMLQALGMGAVAILGNGMNLGIESSYYFSVFPIVALAIILPISFNGIGVREGGFIYFLGLRGIPQEKALTLSLSFFSIQVISSLLGGLVYGLGLHKK